MKFTGERYVPRQAWANVAYKRYIFAQPLATGKHVVDVGSGEGYGSHLRARRAASVVGVDLSAEAVRRATLRYAVRFPKLRYIKGSAIALPFESSSVDRVVAFEVLEHIAQHDEMLAEVRRVLRPGGLFLVSTPNKLAYSDVPKYRNPFHVTELYFDAFRALVESHFDAVRPFTQSGLKGNMIAPLDETQPAPLQVRTIHQKNRSDDSNRSRPIRSTTCALSQRARNRPGLYRRFRVCS